MKGKFREIRGLAQGDTAGNWQRAVCAAPALAPALPCPALRRRGRGSLKVTLPVAAFGARTVSVGVAERQPAAPLLR